MAHFLMSIPRLQKKLICKLSFIWRTCALDFAENHAIFLKYSIQKSSLVDELAPPVLKNMNEHLFKPGQCFA